MSTSASHDVKRRCVPHLLDEVDIKITVHHSLELLVVAMAARHAVAACRIDLKLHAPRRFPQLRVLCADLFPDDAKFLFKVLGIHRFRHAVLRGYLDFFAAVSISLTQLQCIFIGMPPGPTPEAPEIITVVAWRRLATFRFLFDPASRFEGSG